ncbi:alpha-amylase family glycosyl hydrolase [Halobaculum magnesiiphilum]|uniref:Alpha-amylase n=1 Tax=Halobaculum magnesiiphilum TaxID=1017351 RepID=A0A8T8WIF6_9EURY|nr:alpha-amylase family glycosyl hydrolase [Halobaculum magnesiiphilum]QZP39645.1 alpha-amylase [Halobaculum magnesiiphilum]
MTDRTNADARERDRPIADPDDPTHHPGPPRATSVGESIELAPRNLDAVVDVGPDGAATGTDGRGRFTWRVVDAPEDSDVSLGDGAVVHFTPDSPGTYRVELTAPDAVHEQTVRAYPDERADATLRVAKGDFDAPTARVTPDRVSVAGPFNDWTVAGIRPYDDGEFLALDVRLPPGEHIYSFALDDRLADGVMGEHVVPGPGRPRLHLDAMVENDAADGPAVVVSADAKAAPAGLDPESTPAGEEPAVEWLFDGRDDLSADHEAVAIDGDTLRVDRSALPGDGVARVHAVPVADRYGVMDTVELSGANSPSDGADTGTVTRPNDPPAWAESPTIYEVFVRSFAGETPDTTFREIERRVPYIDSLHADVLWLTPVLQSPTTHGYHITDFSRTADDLGTREEFESLVETCHDHGIRVVFDLVINHTSRDHPAFQLHSAGVDAFADHYPRRPAAENPSDVEWAGEGTPSFRFNWVRIPDVNYDSPTVRTWMLSVIDEWADVVDGFRCDVAWGVPHGFWKEAAERLRRRDPEFLLLDETIPRDPFMHEAEFHMHYDTTLYEALRGVGSGDLDADAVLDAVDASAVQGFPRSAVQMRYVENHDEDRYRAECGTDALRAAAAATFTLPGAPMVYYGQERGMTDYRGEMAWHDGDTELTDYHRRLSAARREHDALREGIVTRLDYEVRAGDGSGGPGSGGGLGIVGGDDAGGGGAAGADAVTAYARESDGERLAVVLNFGADPVTVDLAGSVDPTDLLGGDDVGVAADHGSSVGVDPGDPGNKRDTDEADTDGTHAVRVDDAVVCRLR